MPCFAKHLRVWESEIVWLGLESDFCLTFSNALSFVPSISNLSSLQKLSEVHSAIVPFCAKHVRVWLEMRWDCASWYWDWILFKEWIFFPVSQRSDYAFKYLKWSVLTYAFRKKGNIFTKLVWVWECDSVLHSNLIQK